MAMTKTHFGMTWKILALAVLKVNIKRLESSIDLMICIAFGRI